MSSTERQRKFRERNPGYFRKYYVRRTSGLEAYMAELEAARIAAEAKLQATLPELKREPLLLPAPVEPRVLPAHSGLAEATTPLPIALPIYIKSAA